MFTEWPLKGPFNANVHVPRVSIAMYTEDSHARIQKFLSERVQLRQRFFFFFFFFLLFSV